MAEGLQLFNAITEHNSLYFTHCVFLVGAIPMRRAYT
jgi:hypothetical protein